MRKGRVGAARSTRPAGGGVAPAAMRAASIPPSECPATDRAGPIHFGLRAKHGEGRNSIVHDFRVQGGRGIQPRRVLEGALLVAEHRHTAAREPPGEVPEGPARAQGLVAIMGAGAVHE